MAGRQIIVSERLNRVVSVRGFFWEVLRHGDVFNTLIQGRSFSSTTNINEALAFMCNWDFALRVERAFALSNPTFCNLHRLFDYFPVNRFTLVRTQN